MQVFKAQIKDKTWILGLGLIICSLFFFCIPFIMETGQPADFNLFIPNFLLAAVYFLILFFGGRLRGGRDGLHPLFLFFILFFISAWSLNREMSVFEESATWFAVLQVLLCVNYIAFAFFKSYSTLTKLILCFVLGVAMVTFAYLTFYLVPLYAVSLAASPLLGISLHSFVPLLFVVYTVVLILRITRENKRLWCQYNVPVFS